MPDYTTLSSQVELFKTKVNALTATTLDANDLVLLASAINTLSQSMGVNDIAAATNDRIAAVETAKNSAITTINNSVNGDRLTDLEADSVDTENRLLVVENYTNTAGGNIAALSSAVTSLDAAIRPNVMNTFVTVTSATYQALNNDRLLVVPVADQVITLPALPVVGNSVSFLDVAGTAKETNFTIARNGQNIQSLSENLIVDVASASFTLTYYNTASGWRIA